MVAFYGVFVLIVLSGIVIFFHGLRRQRSWRGTVNRIEEIPAGNIDGLDTKAHVVFHYRTDDGKEGKIRLEKRKFERMYPGLKVGDRLVKETGKDYPVKEFSWTETEAE